MGFQCMFCGRSLWGRTRYKGIVLSPVHRLSTTLIPSRLQCPRERWPAAVEIHHVQRMCCRTRNNCLLFLSLTCFLMKFIDLQSNPCSLAPHHLFLRWNDWFDLEAGASAVITEMGFQVSAWQMAIWLYLSWPPPLGSLCHPSPRCSISFTQHHTHRNISNCSSITSTENLSIITRIIFRAKKRRKKKAPGEQNGSTSQPLVFFSGKHFCLVLFNCCQKVTLPKFASLALDTNIAFFIL